MKTFLRVLTLCSLFLSAQNFVSAQEGRVGTAKNFSDVLNILSTSTIKGVNFEDHTIQDVFTTLSTTTGLHIICSEAASVSDKKVTLTLNNERSVLDVFRIVNRVLDGALKIVWDDGFIVVKLANEVSPEEYEVRVYNIGALQYQPTDFKGPDLSLSQGTSDSFAQVELGPTADTPPTTPDEILEMVKQFTGGATWDEQADYAKIQVKGQLLIIKQTPEVHKQIEELLMKLASR